MYENVSFFDSSVSPTPGSPAGFHGEGSGVLAEVFFKMQLLSHSNKVCILPFNFITSFGVESKVAVYIGYNLQFVPPPPPPPERIFQKLARNYISHGNLCPHRHTKPPVMSPKHFSDSLERGVLIIGLFFASTGNWPQLLLLLNLRQSLLIC